MLGDDYERDAFMRVTRKHTETMHFLYGLSMRSECSVCATTDADSSWLTLPEHLCYRWCRHRSLDEMKFSRTASELWLCRQFSTHAKSENEKPQVPMAENDRLVVHTALSGSDNTS